MPGSECSEAAIEYLAVEVLMFEHIGGACDAHLSLQVIKVVLPLAPECQPVQVAVVGRSARAYAKRLVIVVQANGGGCALIAPAQLPLGAADVFGGGLFAGPAIRLPMTILQVESACSVNRARLRK